MTASDIRTSTNAKYNPLTGRLTVKNLDVEGAIGYAGFTTVCNGHLQVNQTALINGNLTVAGELNYTGKQPAPYMVRWLRGSSVGIYEDTFINISWDASTNNVTLRQPTSRLYGVQTMVFTYLAGTFPLGNAILLSTSTQNYYNISGSGQVQFTIGPQTDANSGALHPLYRVSLTWAGPSTTHFVHLIVEKYT